MRLPPKDDPHGDREGALPRGAVIAALKENGVHVRELVAPDLFMLDQGEVFEAQSLTDPVGGLMVRHLARVFAIPLLEFYYDPLTGRRRGSH